MKPEFGISPETELNALLFGSSLAAVRAINGIFGTIDDVKKTLESQNLKISKIGLDQHKKLAEKLEEDGIISRKSFLNEPIAKACDYWIFFVASMITEAPISTVGLGDCLTAGILIGET